MANLPSEIYITSREGCDRAGYSRPDSFLRAWRAAALPIYKRASGRNVVALVDFEKFIQPGTTLAEATPEA